MWRVIVDTSLRGGRDGRPSDGGGRGPLRRSQRPRSGSQLRGVQELRGEARQAIPRGRGGGPRATKPGAPQRSPQDVQRRRGPDRLAAQGSARLRRRRGCGDHSGAPVTCPGCDTVDLGDSPHSRASRICGPATEQATEVELHPLRDGPAQRAVAVGLHRLVPHRRAQGPDPQLH